MHRLYYYVTNPSCLDNPLIPTPQMNLSFHQKMDCKKGRHRSPQNYNRLWPSASLSVEVVIYSQVSETLVPTHLYVYVYTKFISKICFFIKTQTLCLQATYKIFFPVIL